MELQIPRVLLAGLTPDSFPDWAGLLADAQRRLAALPREGCPDRRVTAVDAAERRRAWAELDRWVKVRDRHCALSTCRRPARECDLDHTTAWSQHGPSAAWNLGALCRRHHRMKHIGGWRLEQPEPGVFLWRSRAGMTYLVEARPITDRLPLPLPPPPGRRRRPLPSARSYPPERRGFSGDPDGDTTRPRPAARDARTDPVLTYVGGSGPPVFDDEPPF